MQRHDGSDTWLRHWSQVLPITGPGLWPPPSWLPIGRREAVWLGLLSKLWLKGRIGTVFGGAC